MSSSGSRYWQGVWWGRLTVVVFALLVLMALPKALSWADTGVPDPAADAIEVDLDEGVYQAPVTLEGGSGRASISSPARLEVRQGRLLLEVVWSSPNYDYMVVAARRYLPFAGEGNSRFWIPVLALDEPFPVVGDTTAMSEPHEIDYTIEIRATDITRVAGGVSVLPYVAMVCAGAGVVTALRLARRARA